MMNTKQYYYEFLYERNSINGLLVSDFLKDINTSFIPKFNLSEKKDFDVESYFEIAKLPPNERIHIIGMDNSIFNVGLWLQTRLQPRMSGLMIRYLYMNNRLTMNEIEHLISLPTFKIGFEENHLYRILQSEDNPQYYRSDIGKEYTKAPLLKNYYDRDIIDISKNPGREHFLPGIKFIPAFRIWFGQEAQDLFGRKKILDYPHSIYTKVLPNGVIEMQLMKNILKCGSWRNQWKQRNIVKYFGIEKLEVPKY